MKSLATVLLFSSMLTLPAEAASSLAHVNGIPPEVQRRGQSSWAASSPALRAFVDEQVRAGRGHASNEAALRIAVKARFGPQPRALENEVVFLVFWKSFLEAGKNGDVGGSEMSRAAAELKKAQQQMAVSQQRIEAMLAELQGAQSPPLPAPVYTARPAKSIVK